MSDAAERNTEIWSTRLQRELLALTTDNAPDDAQDAVNTVLPSFVSVKSHELNIEKGDCAVSFVIDLPAAKKKQEETAKEEEATEEGATEEGAPDEGATKEDNAEKEPSELVVTLDASLEKKADGSVDPIAVAYPFLKPAAILVSGADRFPENSTIKNGDFIDIEVDWTPSLQLKDGALNIALKIKECISQGEPFHASTEEKLRLQDPVDELMNRAKRIGTSFSKGLRGLTEGKPDGEKGKKGLRLGRKKKEKPKAENVNPGEVRIGDEINMLEAPWVDCQGVYSCKAIRRPAMVAKAMAEAAQATGEKTGKDQQVSFTQPNGDGEVPGELGPFMRAQAGGISQAASASFAGAGAMFRNFTQSARSVLEESFLMITDTHMIEMRSNKLNLSTGTVTFAIPIELLAKLKFRRQESVSLFFKPAPDDPLIYMCPDSADCVHQIQSVLKRKGVKGKHTNAATHKAINHALHLVQEIQTKELALKHDPSVDRVNEIMDLYRQAAERFEVAGDVRHEEVVTHMRKFLALPLTVSILEGTYKKPEGDLPMATKEGEGVVLEMDPMAADDGDNEAETPAKAPMERETSEAREDRAFAANMDNILKEAEEDLANMKVNEADPELDAMIEDETGLGGDEDDAIADFENMLREADNELAELMNS